MECNLYAGRAVSPPIQSLRVIPFHEIQSLYPWLLGDLCAITAASCSNEKSDVKPLTVDVYYMQTQCADRWGTAEGAQQLVSAAQAYLTQQRLTLYNARATTGPAPAGLSCNTPTGRVLEGAVTTDDFSTVLALGFQER